MPYPICHVQKAAIFALVCIYSTTPLKITAKITTLKIAAKHGNHDAAIDIANAGAVAVHCVLIRPFKGGRTPLCQYGGVHEWLGVEEAS